MTFEVMCHDSWVFHTQRIYCRRRSFGPDPVHDSIRTLRFFWTWMICLASVAWTCMYSWILVDLAAAVCSWVASCNEETHYPSSHGSSFAKKCLWGVILIDFRGTLESCSVLKIPSRMTDEVYSLMGVLCYVLMYRMIHLVG